LPKPRAPPARLVLGKTPRKDPGEDPSARPSTNIAGVSTTRNHCKPVEILDKENGKAFPKEKARILDKTHKAGSSSFGNNAEVTQKTPDKRQDIRCSFPQGPM